MGLLYLLFILPYIQFILGAVWFVCLQWAVQYSTVQYSTVQYSREHYWILLTVLFWGLFGSSAYSRQYGTVQHSREHYWILLTVLFWGLFGSSAYSIQYSTVQYSREHYWILLTLLFWGPIYLSHIQFYFRRSILFILHKQTVKNLFSLTLSSLQLGT